MDISSIREVRGGSLDFQGEQWIKTSELNWEIEINDPVTVTGTVTNTGDGFLVQAQVCFNYKTNCHRCLDSISSSQKTDIIEQFALYTPKDIVENVYGFQGDFLDLTECIQEQVFLSLPMKYVCRTDCRGLCHQCGQNLNQKDCECKVENNNPQFAKLKSLFTLEGGGSNGKPKK